MFHVDNPTHGEVIRLSLPIAVQPQDNDNLFNQVSALFENVVLMPA